MKRFLFCALMMVSPFALAEDTFAPDDRVINVIEGDTLSDIVQNELKSPKLWPRVAEYNGLEDPNLILPGMVIRIPLEYTKAPPSAKVVFFKGGVVFRDKEQKIISLSKRGKKLFFGDSVKTSSDGFVSLQFNAETLASIQPDSLVRLKHLACEEWQSPCKVDLEVVTGSINSKVHAKPGERIEYTITSPQGVAAVRGTRFDASSGAQKTQLEVTKGSVVLSALGKEQSVNQGQGSRILTGEAPEAARQLLPATSEISMPDVVSSGDWVSWKPVENASAYQVLVARDDALTQPVYSKEVSEPKYSPKGISPGEYVLSVRAIDVDGFKGIRLRAPLVIPELALIEIPGDIRLRASGYVVQVTIDEAAFSGKGYELQLSPNADFSEKTIAHRTLSRSTWYTVPEKGVWYARIRVVLEDGTLGPYGVAKRVKVGS